MGSGLVSSSLFGGKNLASCCNTHVMVTSVLLNERGSGVNLLPIYEVWSKLVLAKNQLLFPQLFMYAILKKRITTTLVKQPSLL